ncbi:RNA-directed DNA polymerase, eukaryota [Tanacetum coccineum]
MPYEEIKEAVWDCGSSKAPGPDGFSFAFVKKYWDIIQKDLYDFINSFFASSELPYGANSSFFTLIPKVNNPTLITDFRPISLIGIHYKIIAKILANRLSKVIDKIVSKEQSTFIVGCQILDGPVILSEIIECPTSEFSINRGLRQGDPLSLFLFILVMEGLHNAFAEAVGNGLISGININNSTINISHLFFIDDVIITTDWNARDLENIILILHVFYLASGLKINIQKSNIYGIGFNEEEVSNMASNAGCIVGCGTRIRFWKDIWVGEAPLFIRTNIGVRNLAYFRDMLNEIGQVNIEVSEYTCVWSLGSNGTFTVTEARNLIDQKMLPSLAPSTTWGKNIPCKVNIFMWRLLLDRIPHRLNLSLRGMDIPAIYCFLCNGNVESATHIFFECIIASEMWKLVYRWCAIPFVQALSFEAFKDWFSTWHAPKEMKHRLYVISTSVLWWLWKF